jgi:hypothetical protein
MTKSGNASIPQCKDDPPDFVAVYPNTFARGSKEKKKIPRGDAEAREPPPLLSCVPAPLREICPFALTCFAVRNPAGTVCVLGCDGDREGW